ncbi:hypothetical protein [Natrinema sp. CGMCC1.2065]|uniref:hypothetical protein n=1 Tax=Natrinema sp. CGMCC1.2065 TaxID=3445767 RepID=UPI003F49F3CC
MAQKADEVFDAVADTHRRRVLFALLETPIQTDSPMNLDSPPDGETADETNRIAYRHKHLPKLDEYGYINWLPSVNSIERGPRFDEIKPVLELLAAHQTKLAKIE